jgi:prepilin-type N-terminal cleavage/methylation domain-containing protein
MQDQQQESGFTLIEVMVVVAIIGILVAIAVPQYQDYIARSRIIEGMNLSSGAKLAETEALVSIGVHPLTKKSAAIFWKSWMIGWEPSPPSLPANFQLSTGTRI